MRMWPINTLLAAGADIQKPDPDGNTILHFLSESLYSVSLTTHDELGSKIEYFLSLGVSIDSSNSLGETPDSGTSAMIELILTTKQPPTAKSLPKISQGSKLT